MNMRELDVFDCSLDGVNLIEASAGTGKTWNICGLYLRLLLEQQRTVDEILVVTFTKAATAELRQRIRSRLVELARALATDDNADHDPFVERFVHSVIESGRVGRQEAEQRIELALQSFDSAAIFTIHGFCQRALAETPFAASLPFRLDFLADDAAIRHEVALDFWRQRVSQAELPDGLAAHLLNSGFGPDQLAAQLGRRLQKPLALLRWPEFPAMPSPSLQDLERAFHDARQLWELEGETITGAILAALNQLNAGTYKEQSVKAGAEAWRQYFVGGDALAAVDDKQKLFGAGRLAGKTKKGCTTPSHKFFAVAEELLGLQHDILAFFNLKRLQLLHDWLAQGPEELLRRKHERRLVSYDDLLAKLQRALTGDDLPWLAAAIRKRYPCALIDEFQDTDPVQFQIFSRLYLTEQRGPIFLVGDPKQAIYSFRSADLNTYLAARSAADAQHTLSANQRSTPGLIKALNLLFAANPGAFILDGLNYQEVAVGLKPRKPFHDLASPGADLQVWMLPSEEEGLLPKEEARRLAILATAAEIARLLRQAREDGRITIDQVALKPADIAVIVRSHAQGSAMKQALTALGIGCVELDQASIFKSCQAEEVERLLQAVADPTYTGRIKAALATELLGLDGSAIAVLNDDEEQLTGWVQKFQGYRALWLEHGFGFMWRALLRQEKAAARLLALPAGERKLTNLLHLGELLQQAAATQPGIEGLLRWLARSRLGQQDSLDETAQLRLESDENLVQILTVHKAKGLEFPIVFCPFLFDGRAGGGGHRLEGLEYHRQEQGVIDFSLDEAQIEEGKAIAKMEAAAEDARLLYVALTRAVYRCYLVAGCYSMRLSPKESLRSPLNWLVVGAGGDFAEWQDSDRIAGDITAAWQDLAAASAGQIALAPLPTTAGLALPPDPHAAESFAVRQATQPLLEGWRLGSFSALNRQSSEREVVAAPDHDAGPADLGNFRGEPPLPASANDFLSFPAGPAAGECLHRALELTDFSNPATWDEAILGGLRERPPSAYGRLPEAPLAAMLRGLFAALMTTPLHDGLRLETLTRDRCLTELEFCFPTGPLAASDLNRLLAAYGYDQPKLSFSDLQGFIKGFIDLVFFHDGRYYLLDWKSNHLGHTASDYRPEAIAQAMRHHGYHLQYLLYSVALHRYLRHRLTDYDFNRHFGGCFYLFVRGVRPGWLNADGTACGVFFHRPEFKCIEELDRLFVTV